MGARSTEPIERGNPNPMDSDIRWWAKQNNVECPPTGPIPDDVRRRYLEANGEKPPTQPA